MNWIHLENPSIETMSEYSTEYHFPMDYLLSTLDPDEVSRGEHLDRNKPALISLLYPIEDLENP